MITPRRAPEDLARRFVAFAAGAAILLTHLESIADPLRYTSASYPYAISLPQGWIQIPEPELASLRARLPPQARHIVYDAAFQHGNAGNWFEWPYVIVQVIPSNRTNLRRLPTEPEFERFVTSISGRKSVARVARAFAEVRDPEERQYLESILPSLTGASIQIDVRHRRYHFAIDGADPRGPMRAYVAGVFLSDGHVIQLNAYESARQFQQNLGKFMLIFKSIGPK